MSHNKLSYKKKITPQFNISDMRLILSCSSLIWNYSRFNAKFRALFVQKCMTSLNDFSFYGYIIKYVV